MTSSDHYSCNSDGSCITCSDAATVMCVVALAPEGDTGICVDALGNQTEVLLGLIARPDVGDVLLVHAATAIQRIDHTPAGSHEVR